MLDTVKTIVYFKRMNRFVSYQYEMSAPVIKNGVAFMALDMAYLTL